MVIFIALDCFTVLIFIYIFGRCGFLILVNTTFYLLFQYLFFQETGATNGNEVKLAELPSSLKNGGSLSHHSRHVLQLIASAINDKKCERVSSLSDVKIRRRESGISRRAAKASNRMSENRKAVMHRDTAEGNDEVQAARPGGQCMAQVQQETWTCSMCSQAVVMPDIVRDLPAQELAGHTNSNGGIVRSPRTNVRFVPVKRYNASHSRLSYRTPRNAPKKKIPKDKKDVTREKEASNKDGCASFKCTCSSSDCQDTAAAQLIKELLMQESLLGKIVEQVDTVRWTTSKISSAIICTIIILVCAKQIKKFYK